jgi:hypothetical protein
MAMENGKSSKHQASVPDGSMLLEGHRRFLVSACFFFPVCLLYLFQFLVFFTVAFLIKRSTVLEDILWRMLYSIFASSSSGRRHMYITESHLNSQNLKWFAFVFLECILLE